MENGWINKKNVWAILAGVLFLAAIGFFIESRPKIKRMKVTAYCPCKKCCGKYADGKTSIGKDAWKTLGVAADPILLPYGTRLNIPGVGIRIVDDTGGAMRQDAKKGICHIDVRFHNHETAEIFGVQWSNVEILSPVN